MPIPFRVKPLGAVSFITTSSYYDATCTKKLSSLVHKPNFNIPFNSNQLTNKRGFIKEVKSFTDLLAVCVKAFSIQEEVNRAFIHMSQLSHRCIPRRIGQIMNN